MKTRKGTYPDILAGKLKLGPYPMEGLRRVERPTTKITEGIARFDSRQTGFAMARRGELGDIGSKKQTPPAGAAALATALRTITGLVGARPKEPSSRVDAQTISHPAGLPEDPSILSRHVKSLAYFLGADVVGVCKLPQWAVYSHDAMGEPVDPLHKNAICIVVDQGRETMEAATGKDWISESQSFRGYAMCAFIGQMIAQYVSNLGYPSRLHYALDYQVVVSPLLLLSGIGEVSRAGIILNPFLGLRFKASVVTTDLPLEPDTPIDFGLQDFCSKCKKCAVECPSRSIPTGDKVMKNGYENWAINSVTCTKFRLGNPNGLMCGRCIKVCPWNKPPGWTHDLVRSMIKRTPFMNGPIIRMDTLWGYGGAERQEQWWFDR